MLINLVDRSQRANHYARLPAVWAGVCAEFLIKGSQLAVQYADELFCPPPS